MPPSVTAPITVTIIANNTKVTSKVSLIIAIDLTTMIVVTLINKITIIINTKVQPTLAACSSQRARHNRR